MSKNEMQQMKKIALIVDNPKRDLRGLCIVAASLMQYGCEVYIVPMYQQGYELPLIAPDLVVVNYARPANDALLKTYKKLGYRVAVLDTEGGVFTENSLDSPIHGAKEFKAKGYHELVDDYCFWGHEIADAYQLYSGLEQERICVTGCPRYDVGSAPFSGLLHFSKSGQILVNTNFSAINPKFTKSYQQELDIFLSQGWDRDYMERFFGEMRDVFPKYKALIRDAALALPDRQFQIRVHPFESEAVYKQFFRGIANVTIDSRGDIFDVIAAADIILHLNCGSAIDSARLNKIAIQLEMLNNDILRAHTPLPGKVSILANSLEDLVSLIADKKRCEDEYEKMDVMKYIYPFFHKSDGQASERVAAFLSKTACKSEAKAKRSIKMALIGGRADKSINRVVLGILTILFGGLFAGQLSYFLKPARRYKSFDRKIVGTYMNHISRLCGQKTKYKCQYAASPTGANLSAIRITRNDS